MEEEFKICFENYEVSNIGNIRKKLKNGDYVQLKCSIQNKGYKYFQLNRDKKRTNYLVHHLVAKFFIGERPDKLVIDHIDRNPLNNNVLNLRYITQKENCHNTDRFNTDIKEEDRKKRNCLLTKIYNEKHKEEIKLKKKIYCENHKEEANKRASDYYIKNKEDKLKYAKEYREKHREQINSSRRKNKL